MADRSKFQERLARIQPRNNRKQGRDTRAWQNDTTESWFVSAVLDIVFNGWMFFLSGLAFAVFAGLVFVDFIGFEVGLLAMFALGACLYFLLKSEL